MGYGERPLRTETVTVRCTPQEKSLWEGLMGFKSLWTLSDLMIHGMELVVMEEAKEGVFAAEDNRVYETDRKALMIGADTLTEPVLQDADPSEALGSLASKLPADLAEPAADPFKKLMKPGRKAPAKKPAGRPAENGSHKGKGKGKGKPKAKGGQSS